MLNDRDLSGLYRQAHDCMRNIDGLQPQEAFDELLKYLLFKQADEDATSPRPRQLTLVSPGFRQNDDKEVRRVRRRLREHLQAVNSWSTQLWTDRKFHLSDEALSAVHDLFRDIRFSELDFDVRSAALRTFLNPELRRGLGIFLTPDNVARMSVDVVRPPAGSKVYDPACGSGTFLIEVLRSWGELSRSGAGVWGSDINPRMLLLAELNLDHVDGLRFHRQIADALSPPGGREWPRAGQFDFIFTNPPFGVNIDGAHYDFRQFETCRVASGVLRRRQQSEVVFTEQCLRYLKPGGTLAIVLPRSVITNATHDVARAAIDKLACLEAVVSLPAETFAAAGTQTTTAVLFFRRRSGSARRCNRPTAAVEVRNVGYDATGRPRPGDELPKVGADISASRKSNVATGLCRFLTGQTGLAGLATALRPKRSRGGEARIDDVAELVCTGRTAARSAYTDSGLFIIKVGNLTGQGISWIPRDRNFVGGTEAAKRRRSEKLIVRPGDILLTSSAHSPKYIAKKVDIVTEIPGAYSGEATFVGEVMLIRPKKEIDPFALLAYLRMPETTKRLQSMIRGQTAHLMPPDVLSLEVPEEVVEPDSRMQAIAGLTRRQVEIATALNQVTLELEHHYGDLGDECPPDLTSADCPEWPRRRDAARPGSNPPR